MSAPSRDCPHCGHPVPAGAAYCPHCGEPVDPALIAELQWLHRSLMDLEQRIAAHQGDMTITALRDEYRAQYQVRRRAPGTVPAGAAAAPLAAPGAVAPQAPTPGAQFSWSAFFAEQSIAIMAYTGGFLLLVATLIFETGGWHVVNDTAKLVIIAVVYVLFGGLGLALRHVQRLHTVGQAYLAVFALLTPLMALAVYLFALRGLGVSAEGMFCLASGYAMIVYLLLARQTRLSAYGYLAVIAFCLAGQAALLWSAAPLEWWTFALAASALVLLVPRRLGLPDYVIEPATQVAALAAALALLGGEIQGIAVLADALAGQPAPFSLLAFAAAACAVAVLSLALGLTLRDAHGTAPFDAHILDVLDWLTAALAAQAVVALASLARVSPSNMAYVLAALALAELGVALVLHRAAPARRGVRMAVEALAIALGAAGVVSNLGAPDPNWPSIAGFAAAAAVAVWITVVERQRWWLVAGGIALALAYRSPATSIALASTPGHSPFTSAYYLTLSWLALAFTLAIWLLALGAGLRDTLRPYARPLYVVALLCGLYVLTLVFALTDAQPYQTTVLAAFSICSFVAGRRDHAPIAGSIGAGVFGALAVLPLTLGAHDGVTIAVAGLAPSLVALALRRTLGRRDTLPFYAVAIWAAVIAQVRFASGPVTTSAWIALGIPFAAWFMLAVTIPGAIAAFWEGHPWLLLVPAYFAVSAIATTPAPLAQSGETVVLAALGLAIGRWRGRWWDVIPLAGAAVGALLALLGLDALPGPHPMEHIVLLGLTALIGYAAVLRARAARETTLAAAALIFLPMLLESIAADPAWIYTCVLAAEALVMMGLGVGMRARTPQWLGAALVGVAALHGAVVAYQSGVPIVVIIALLALVLLAGAAWLSVRGLRKP